MPNKPLVKAHNQAKLEASNDDNKKDKNNKKQQTQRLLELSQQQPALPKNLAKETSKAMLINCVEEGFDALACQSGNKSGELWLL